MIEIGSKEEIAFLLALYGVLPQPLPKPLGSPHLECGIAALRPLKASHRRG